MKVLVDSSAWIDFFNNADQPHVSLLASLLKSEVDVSCCPPVLQEVLQGIRDDKQFEITREYLLELELFRADPIQAAVESAQLFSILQRKGMTIRKNNDCLIAWYAMKFDASLLHNDKSFVLLAQHTDLVLL